MKDKNQTHWAMLEIAEQLAPEISINFWPKIETKLNLKRKADLVTYSNQSQHLRSVSHFPNQRQWLKALLSFIAFVLLVGSLIAAVPQVRAEIGHLLQRFGFILVEPIPSDQPTQTLVATEAEAVSSEVVISSLSLEEAQKLVPFPIPIPTWLPEGLALTRVTAGEGPHGSSCIGENCTSTTVPIQIVLLFKPDENSSEQESAGLMIDIFDRPIEGGFVYPASEAQRVMVNGREAVYVVGSWQTDPNADPDLARLKAQLDALHSDVNWNSAIDEQALSWQDEKGFVYVVRASGLNLTEKELIKIAESIH